MANERVILEFSLQDVNNSIKGANKDAQALRGTLESIQKISSKPASRAKAAAFGGAMGNNEYDIARGSAGATGASGRDFANQARGLDGLVRLYATYAANVFAAGAAFRALSNAADTTNMIKGMDQLGAATGQSLGTVAKNLVATTDGAISFREAIEATTKSSAAGLSAKQINDLGKIAKSASQALGVSMPDALSRLTRGVSKLEPELLDELGLFTKIGPAVEDYARSIGKTAGSLSDFERRQAFTVAVIKEGLDKFNAIELSANPYDKLLASLQNLGQGALEIVNKFLKPLVDLLSQSPGALLAVVAALGVNIVKTAIPAVGQYREGLQKAAETSRSVFTQIYKDQQKSISDLAGDAGAQAEASFRNTAGTRSKIADLQKQAKTFSAGKKDFAALAGKDPFALTAEEIKSLDNRARYLKGRNDAEAEALRAHIIKIKAIRAESAAAGDVASEKLVKGTEGILTTAGSNDVIYKRKLTQASMDAIKVSVAETQATYGMRAAFKKLGEELNLARAGMLEVEAGVDKNGKKIIETAPKLGLLRTGYTAVTSSIGILGQKLATTVNALNPWIVGIGLAVEAFVLFDAWMTKTGKQTEAFNKALQDSADATDNVNRTLEALAKQPGIATASIKGIFALSNASRGVTDSIETTIDASKTLLAALNNSLWDRVKNRFMSLFGNDVTSNTASALAATLQSQLKLFSAAGMGDEATASFKKALGVESLDIDTVTKAFKNGTITQEEYAKASKALDLKLLETSSNLQNFKSNAEAVTKAYDEFIQSTANNNPLFKVGAALEDMSLSMEKISTGDLKNINAAFNDLVDNPKKIAQFGTDFVNQFVAIRQEFKTTLQEYEAYGQSIRGIDDQISKTKQDLLNLQNRKKDKLFGDPIGQFFETGSIKTESGLNKTLQAQETAKKTVEGLQLGVDISVFDKARKIFSEGVDASFKEGAKLIAEATGQAQQKAAMSITQAGIGALGGEVAARASGNLKQEEFALQLRGIQTTIDLISSNTLLTATINESNAYMAFEQAKKDKADPRTLRERENAFSAAEMFKRGIEKVKSGEMTASGLDNLLTGGGIDKFLKPMILAYQRQLAQQEATATEVRGKAKGASIETARAVGAGKLEDQNKLKNIENDINQLLAARKDILNGIDTFNSAQGVKEKAILEDKSLQTKQEQEIAGYEKAMTDALAINNADGDEYFRTLDKQLAKVKERQAEEAKNKGLSDRLKFQAEELNNAVKLNALKEASIDQEIARKNTLNNILGISSEQSLKEISSLENQKLQNKFALELKPLQENYNNLLEQDNKLETERVLKAKDAVNLTVARQNAELNNKGLQDQLRLIEARFSIEERLRTLRNQSADAQAQQAQDELNYRKALGLITDEELGKETAKIERAKLARETAGKLATLDKDIAARDLAAKAINDTESRGGLSTQGEIDGVAKLTENINLQAKVIADVDAQKRNSINRTEELTRSMTGFSQIVQNSFVKMGDALVTFAITGKGSFKDLINSMLEDLLRFEMSNQMKGLYSAFGGLSGMGSYLVSAFTGAPPVPSAKGSVYDTGLQTFAKGGMFTNSVVNQPTLFKFARGTGLMGEAGPEAIMPLKRDSNGNLGVRAGNTGGKVDIVVNNYSNQPAKTKETLDSRGNRRIEVIVGDMVAGELNRVGSTTQQAMTASYGTSPLLARR